MRDLTLYDLFVRNGSIYNELTAVVAGDDRISFGRLLTQTDELAGRLAAYGIETGDRIGVLAMNHPDFFTLFGAAAKLGAVLVPLNWRLSNDELSYIIEDSEPKILFCDRNQLVKSLEIGEPLSLHVCLFEETGEQLQAKTAVEKAHASDDAPLCIIYTAAVEGKPRGAVLSHANLISANIQVILAMGLTQQDVNLAMLPLFHITGMNLALAVMQLGGKNVIVEKFSESETKTLTLQENVSLWGSFPPILQRMVKEIEDGGVPLPSLKYAVGLDGPDNISGFEQVTGAKFWILYGQSETSGFVTLSEASEKPGSAGRQGPLSTYMIAGENDTELTRGETGEIVVRGPLVFQGYWKQDEVNRKTFRNDWHHTGDLGMIDGDGYLIYKGRKPEKELIKPGGENVYPAEVEEVILKHPDVEAVSVIGVPDEKFGEGVKAVCVLKKGSSLDAGSLIEFVGSRIARYKKPGYVQFVEELPVKEGRIDREVVKKLYGGSSP